MSAAGIAFPYRLKDIWEAAGGRRLFGVPAVALAGAGGVIVLGALLVLFIFNKSISAQFAVTAHLSVEFMLGVWPRACSGTSARSCTTGGAAST